MEKPWFGRKRIGWGWGLPQTWQGWCLLAIYIISLRFIVGVGLARFIIVLLLTVVFIGLVAITSGRPQWGTWHNKDN